MNLIDKLKINFWKIYYWVYFNKTKKGKKEVLEWEEYKKNLRKSWI